MKQCPANTVDEHAARACAGMVVVLAALSLWPSATILTVALAIDFMIRGFGSRRYSPLRWIAKHAVRAIGLEPKPVYAPPKRFAAQLGAVLAVLATTLHALALQVPVLHLFAVVVIGLLIAAASLEAVFAICLACWIYPLVFRERSATTTP